MNQGNPVSSQFGKDNWVYKDGGLFFQFADNDQWTALLLKFESQSNKTNDHTGNPE